MLEFFVLNWSVRPRVTLYVLHGNFGISKNKVSFLWNLFQTHLQPDFFLLFRRGTSTVASVVSLVQPLYVYHTKGPHLFITR